MEFCCGVCCWPWHLVLTQLNETGQPQLPLPNWTPGCFIYRNLHSEYRVRVTGSTDITKHNNPHKTRTGGFALRAKKEFTLSSRFAFHCSSSFPFSFFFFLFFLFQQHIFSSSLFVSSLHQGAHVAAVGCLNLVFSCLIFYSLPAVSFGKHENSRAALGAESPVQKRQGPGGAKPPATLARRRHFFGGMRFKCACDLCRFRLL